MQDSTLFRSCLTDGQIAANVRRLYLSVLNVCAGRVVDDGANWRDSGHVSGCASNAQLWILGSCLGHWSTFETDEDLARHVARMISSRT